MRILLFLFVIFLQGTANSFAEGSFSPEVKSIHAQVKDHELAISFFQLTHGEVTLLQGPHHQNVLAIPGGQFSIKEAEKWLSIYNVKKINQLIITTGPAINNWTVKELLSKYRIKEITASPATKTSLFENLDIANQVVLKSWEEGTVSRIFPEVSAIVQYAGDEKDEGLDFLIQFYNHRIFMMNSVSSLAEQRLLTKRLGEIQIFKMPKYIQEGPLSEKLIKNVNPQVSVLFSSVHETDSDVIDDVLRTWSEIYSTKDQGTVTIKFTESGYEVFTFPMKS